MNAFLIAALSCATFIAPPESNYSGGAITFEPGQARTTGNMPDVFGEEGLARMECEELCYGVTDSGIIGIRVFGISSGNADIWFLGDGRRQWSASCD